MNKKYKAIIVPGIHWDRARDYTFQQYRIKLVNVLDKLIRLLNNDHRYRSFVFGGQTVILEDYLEIRPEMERELKRLICDGRVLVGPWYTIADEFLSSPEAIIRNLIIGHMIAESFGKVMKIGYVSGSFGHISQLPQILMGFDIDSVIFTHGMGDEGETLGSEFFWYAPDGKTRVLAVHEAITLRNTGDFGHASPESIIEECQQLIDVLKPYARTPNILLDNGSDFSEPHPQLPDIIEHANEKLSEVELIHGTFADYLELVRASELKKYQGELRGSKYRALFPGVLSSRMYIKQANESAQTLMERWVEPFSALSWLETGFPYPKAFLWHAWKELIKNHSHHNICGCGIDEVHHDDMIRFSWVQQVGEELAHSALKSLFHAIAFTDVLGSPLVVFNPLAWPRLDSVSMEVETANMRGNPVVKNSSGEVVPTQVALREDGVSTLTFLAQVPALGYATYYLSSGERLTRSAETVKVQPRMVENKFYRININANGSLDILDKQSGREYKGCNLYEDREDAGDGHAYLPIKRSKPITNKGSKAGVRILESGPIKTTVEIKLSMNLPKGLTKDRTSRTSAKLSCPIITRLTLYTSIPRIDFITTFENKVEDHRLRVLFPTDIKTDVVHVEGHFDVLARPLNTSNKTEGVQEATNHKNAFIDISDGERGFAVISRGLPEYEVRRTRDGCVIYLTLLRCVGWVSREDSPKRAPSAQCIGIHTFFYSIFPHGGDWISAQVQRRAHEHNVPMRVISRLSPANDADVLPVKVSLPPLQSFISVEPPNLVVTALKKCELGDGLILRFYNSTSETVDGIIRTHRPVKSARLVNLNEQPLPFKSQDMDNPKVEDDGIISLRVDGHEIKTVELIFEHTPVRDLAGGN